MSKGIKMRSAKDRHGRTYPVEELQRLADGGGVAPDLICDDPACGCDVRFVPRHPQNRANRVEPIDVPAYIGLTGKSEHVAGCRYNASGQLKIIAAQSDPEFLKALDDGKRELRLLILHNGLSKFGLSGNAPTLPGAGAASASKTATQVLPSDKKLDSYLRTVSALLALRAQCESDALLASELILRLGTKRIPWKQFFFEHDRFDEAWELVAKGGNVYPIAVVGSVQSCRPYVGAGHETNFLNCRSLTRETSDPLRKESFDISIAHPDAAWLNSFPVDSEIVMFGLWKATGPVEKAVSDKADRARTVTYANHRLMLNPKFKTQIVVT